MRKILKRFDVSVRLAPKIAMLSLGPPRCSFHYSVLRWQPFHHTYSTDLLGKGPRLPLSLPGLVQEEVFHWQRASFDTWIPDSMGMQRPDAFLEVKLSLRTAPTQCLFLRKGGLLFQSGTVKRDGKKWDKLSGWFIQIHCTHGIVTSTDLNSHAGKEDIVIFPRKKSYCGTKPKIFQWVWN